MIRRDEVTSKVKLLTLTEGSPATILFAQTATRPDGKSRTITQKISIPDVLFARLAAEVRSGDEIEITIVTEWTRKGYTSYLHDFRSLSSEMPISLVAA